MRNRTKDWSPPPVNWFKRNTDASRIETKDSALSVEILLELSNIFIVR